MSRSKSLKRSSKRGKRTLAHCIHVVSIPVLLSGLGIVSFPLSTITDYGMIFGPIGFAATIIEVAEKRYKLFR